MSLASAIRTGDLAELPSRRDEDWRWTDLRGLIRQLPAPSAPLASGALAVGPFDALASRRELIANGQGPAILQIEGEQVLALRIVSQGEGAHAAAIRIQVAPGAKLTLLESYEGEGAYLAQTSLTFTISSGAEVERIVLADEAEDAVTVSEAQVELAPGARFGQAVLAGGARRQRLETRLKHPGGHAEVRMDGAYLLAGKRHCDLTTEVTHGAVDGTTSELIKGVVRDQSRGVFQGRIVVAEGADRTDARMGHHALILDDRAEVDAKPELLIFADDVSCAHGNTVGALDEEALFYMRQRGIPEAEARALLIEAFVGEVVDRITHEGAQDVARAWLAAKLGG
ncbi:Fe-S cluster assembly protein SufD [Phenylobacterium deserti]|uniref:Fe-S cluster assembly protein SufD n=1 Tax=Phenylobacterium deserti TaxID=1914756 RepID=A0A328A973_9CAUL|nr:Fe-S cluster assembly protein SufD [Phenylobacterium deserti]RAK50887.1 Fe-S cluster assembly protein SufD [Phenylobacterium deserti]